MPVQPDPSCVGRFAPSPTGPLHFGSFVAALASWLDARAAGGRWLLRMEDLDRPRVRSGSSDRILSQLESAGLHWDGEVSWQSERLDLYRGALDLLSSREITYWCACTRKEIADSALAPDGMGVYAGTCRDGFARGRSPRAIRVRTSVEPIAFADRLQGAVSQSVEREVGDFVVFRADGTFAYQLAVVVDDAEQGITDVVRGADLIDSTPRQIHLQRLLGLRTPRYLHVPVAVNAAGEKLSKQKDAAEGSSRDLRAALAFLGHAAPADVADRELLAWAQGAWNPEAIPRKRTIALP
ncbi:MAG: tRNA glutamyl-Q(34) synthetase GluQRS [Betaproteobacteria bacterium]